jgi:hypothetical protein
MTLEVLAYLSNRFSLAFTETGPKKMDHSVFIPEKVKIQQMLFLCSS